MTIRASYPEGMDFGARFNSVAGITFLLAAFETHIFPHPEEADVFFVGLPLTEYVRKLQIAPHEIKFKGNVIRISLGSPGVCFFSSVLPCIQKMHRQCLGSFATESVAEEEEKGEAIEEIAASTPIADAAHAGVGMLLHANEDGTLRIIQSQGSLKRFQVSPPP